MLTHPKNNQILTNLVKLFVCIVVSIVVAVAFFFMLHYRYAGVSPNFSSRQSQYFSQEALHQELKDFELLDSGVIRSMSSDPWITIHTDPSFYGKILTIRVSNLSENPTRAQVFFSHPNENFNEYNSIRFTLNNGLNTIFLPSSGYEALRLDLAEATGVSMVVNRVMLANYVSLPTRHWVVFTIAMLASIIFVYCLAFYLQLIRRMFYAMWQTVIKHLRLIKCSFKRFFQYAKDSSKQLILFLKKLIEDNYIKVWYDSQPKSAKVGFCGAAIFALLTHFTVYSGQIWEGHFIGFGTHIEPYGVSSGRWFYNVANSFTFYYIDWASGLFQVLFLSLAVFILVKAFNIKSRLSALLISGIITTFPTMAEINMFTQSIVPLSFAILLSAAGFYVTKLYKFGWLPGAVLVMLGLAIYQSKISVAMVASLIWLIIYVIKENPQPLHLIKYVSRYVLLIAVGLIFYYISWQFFDVQPFYQGLDNISIIGIPSEMPRVYLEVWNYFFSSDFRIESYILSFAYALVGVLSLFLTGCLVRKYKGMKILNVALIVFLTLLLPLAANFSRIFDTGDAIYSLKLTGYAFSFFLLLPIVLIDNFKIKLYGLQKALLAISLMFIIGYFISFSNFMYQNGKVITTYLYQFSNRLAARVEPLLPYSNDNQVMVAGNLLLNPISPIKPIVPNQTIFQEYTSRYIYGNDNTFGGYNNPPYVGAFFPEVMRYLSGIDTSYSGNLERRQYLLDRAISDGMPVYPQEGSVALIDGTVVAMTNFYARLDVEETGFGGFVATANHIGKSTDLEFMYSWYVYKDGQRLYQIYEGGVDHIEYTIDEPGGGGGGISILRQHILVRWARNTWCA